MPVNAFGIIGLFMLMSQAPRLGAQTITIDTTHSGNSFTFTWSAAATEMYQVQSTASLTPPAWNNLGSPIVANNSKASASGSITNSQMLYRVVLLPQGHGEAALAKMEFRRLVLGQNQMAGS